VHVTRQRQWQAAIKRGLHHGARQHMMRRLLQRRADLQHTLGCLAGSSFDRQQTRAADRQRSSLVEQNRMRACQRLQRGAALHQDAPARGLCDTGNEGDRRRENERTRRCRDKHGEAADKIAGHQPGGGSEQNRHRKENYRKPVGKPDERGLRGLCRRHHTHDAGIGALSGNRRSHELECLAGIDRAAKSRSALHLGGRQRLAGQRRLVDDRGGRKDNAIDGNHLPGADKKRVADGDLRNRHIFDTMIESPMRDAWRAIDQRVQIALGAADGEVFQHVAAGIHERNDRAGKRLAEPERSEHRYERNRIHADAPGGKVAHDRIDKARGHRHGRREPALIGKRSVAGDVRGGTDRQAADGDDDQRAPQQPIKID
jgi:hypothetical protein